MPASKMLSICLAFLILASVFSPVAFSSTEENETALAISDAEEATVSAYRAVLDAESAGVNVSSLLSQLDKAAELLVQANKSHEINDLHNATLFARMATDVANEITIEAYKTRDLTLHEYSQRFKFTLAASILGICMVLFVSFLSWRFFKLHYRHHTLKLRPELNSDES